MSNLRLLAALAAAALLTLVGPRLGAAAAIGVGALDMGSVDAIFTPWNQPDSPGCAVVVVRGGETLLLRGYGAADLESGKAIGPDTIFRLGEASQPFTAAAIELAVAAGKISLDQDIRRSLPEMPRYQAPITVRHLLAQESGLSDYRKLIAAASGSGAVITRETALLALVEQRFLRFDPGGERWQTSPSNHLLLAELLERATGQSFRDFTSQHLFWPRRMTRTSFHNPYRAAGVDHASGYSRSAEGGGFEPLDGGREINGPGGAETSAGDLALWLSSHPPFPEESHRFSPMGSYGGFRAAILRRPEAGLSVACLCNLAEIDAAALAGKVADLFPEPEP